MKSAWSGHGYRRLVIEYFTAVLLVAVAAILTWLLRHPFPGIPSSLFFCAVILSAWFGGLGPAFIASILSSATIILWLPWRPVVAPTVANEIPVFLVFLFASLFISWLSDRKRRAQTALRQARDLLEQRVEERTRELKAANEDLKTECAERKKIENALSQSEARLEEAQRMAHIGHWDRDVFTGQITCSDEFLRIFGLPPRSTPLNLTEVQHIIHPDDRARQRQTLAEAQQGLRRYDMEYRIIMPGGEVRIVHSLGDVTRDDSGRAVTMFGTVQDITERKRAEMLSEGQRQILEMITTNVPLSESLTALIRLIEQHASGMVGSILLMDKEGIHLGHGAAPNLPAEYVAAIDGVSIGPNTGSCGTAAYSKEAVFVKDIATDPRWQEYRAVALPHELRACWSTPIFDAQRRVLGTFAMYYRQPMLPEPEHRRLIEMVTHIAALAISRHHYLAALRESEAKLKEAERIADLGYWERKLAVDPADDRITWSEGAWRIFGLQPQNRALSQAELQGMIHPDDRHIQREALADALKGIRNYDAELRIVRPDGEIRFVHVRDEIECDALGKPVRMFGTVQDITELKQAEKLIKARAQEIRAIVENSPDPIIRYDRALRRTYVNPAVIKINGVPQEALLGRTVGSTVEDGAVNATREEVEILHQSLKQVFDTGQPLDLETTWPLPTGRRHYIVHFVPEFDDHGVLTSVLSISRDITERKQAEEAVKESQQLLHLVLATLPVGVSVVNQVGDVVLINAASKRIWGDMIISGSERWARSKGFWHDSGQAIAPTDWASVRALSGGITSLNELIDIESYTGQHKTIQNSAAPIRNADALIVGAVIVNEDVTERVRTEDALHQTQAELFRMARLTIMGELTASIAHEVNQPLAAVVANADAVSRWLAAAPPNLKEAREAIHRIARDGNRAGEVIRRIRTLIKKGEPVRTLLNLNQLIQETLTLTQPELTRKQVSLQTELAPELPRVPADRIQLQQVLLNLVMNALDSMSAVADRQRVLRIRTDHSESDAVQIAVQDNGIGLGPVGTEQVFQPFYTTKPDGLGMGLAISRSIVEAHGGRLWATPNDGFGATFQFTLPIQEGGES